MVLNNFFILIIVYYLHLNFQRCCKLSLLKACISNIFLRFLRWRLTENPIAVGIVCASLLTSCSSFSYKMFNPLKLTSSAKNVTILPCEQNCLRQNIICKKECHNNKKTCLKMAREATAKKYAHYKHEQWVKGKLMVLQLHSFEDPLQCRKPTCNCITDLQTCQYFCQGSQDYQLKLTYYP